ncbi:MAG: hypothetical protein LC737_03780 [Chloroflexi bacterium]|nr:hypothetical protein [Chloroflexota bacterium]
MPYREADDLPIGGRGTPLPVIGQGRLHGDPNLMLATDDWPFVYLPVATIPWVYVGSLLLIGAVALALFFPIARFGGLRHFNWHFFFLGVAFMLLETRSLVTFALLFGTTWMVSSLVFFAILVSVLLAIVVNARWRIRHIAPLYLLLFGMLLVNYSLPLQTMLAIPLPWLRYVLASLVTFAPIFLANVVFSHSFRDGDAADVAFASNLLGVMVGGMLEYLGQCNSVNEVC